MPDDSTTEERAVAALEHLQAAALEMIAAVRAALDVAEDLVRDPAAFVAAARAVVPVPTPGDASHDDGVREEPRVQHIRVS